MKNPRALLTSLITLCLTAVVGFSLASCAGGVPADVQVQKQQPSSSSGTKVIVITGGRLSPSDISVLCVEGYAFLYTGQDTPYHGNPALARFPELDARCKTQQINPHPHTS